MITIEEIRKYEQTHYTLTKLCVLWSSKNLADWLFEYAAQKQQTLQS